MLALIGTGFAMDVAKMDTGVRGVTNSVLRRVLLVMEALRMIVLSVRLMLTGIRDTDANAIMVTVEVYASLQRKLIVIQNVSGVVMDPKIPTAINVS